MQRRTLGGWLPLLAARPTTTTTPAPQPAAPTQPTGLPRELDTNLLLLETVSTLMGCFIVVDDFLVERLKERWGIVHEHLGARDDRDDGITERQRDEWEFEDHRMLLGRLFRLHGLIEAVLGAPHPRVRAEFPPQSSWSEDRLGALHAYLRMDDERWCSGNDPIAR